MTLTRLEHIINTHRASAAVDHRSTEELRARAVAMPSPRSFADALRRPGLSVIAEIKRRSPSAGDLFTELDPACVAASYEEGGAACLSVLTDHEFFGGSGDDLRAARGAVSLPVLRKDFTVDVRDVLDARIMGADAVLLIVAALSDEELRAFRELAEELGMAAIVEVHDEHEISRALDAGATVLGVNQRNLHTFEIDRFLAERLRSLLPDDVIAIAESGVRLAADVAALAAIGYDAVLVGTSLVTSDDPCSMVGDIVMTGAADVLRERG